jgi:hypothetical protein
MKKLFRNVKFLSIWVANSIYSLRFLRLHTPVSLPATIIILGIWFALLTYFLVL